MSGTIIRRPTKFTSSDGSTISYTFPIKLFNWDGSQALSNSYQPVTGANYDFDQLESGLAVKRNGLYTFGFLFVGDPSDIESAADTMRHDLFEAGRGKLWTTDSDGSTLRWCWARLLDIGEFKLGPYDRNTMTVVLNFTLESDFFDETAVGMDGEFTADADPYTFTVSNPGNARVYNAIITLKNTFNAPLLLNNTTGYALQSTSVGAAPTDWLRFDSGRNTVKFSSDGGATWTDDYANFVRQPTQVQLMVLTAGDNDFGITGANGADIVVDFYGAWH